MQAFAAVDGAISAQLVQVPLGRRSYIVKLQDAKDVRLQSPPLWRSLSSEDASKVVLCDDVVIGSVGTPWTLPELERLIQGYMRKCIAAIDAWNRLVDALLASHPNAIVAVDHTAAHYLLAISVPFAAAHTTIHVRVHADNRIEDACIEYAWNHDRIISVALDTPRHVEDALAVVERQRARRAEFMDALAHHMLVLSFDSVSYGSLDCAVVHDDSDARVCWIDISRVTFAPTWGLSDAPSVEDAHRASGIPFVSIALVDGGGQHPVEIAAPDMDAFVATLVAVPATAASFNTWLRRVLRERQHLPSHDD